MSPQETQSLQNFLTQLIQVRGIAKDAQAGAMIAAAVAQQPDAAYLLVQRALLMEQALNNANAQIATLQNQLQAVRQQAPSRGFLDADNWGTPAVQRPMQQQPMQQPMQAMQQPMMQQPMYAAQSPGFFGGGFGGVLGNVATTAAGVAGGAFLFQGIEHLLNRGDGGGFLGSGGGYGGNYAPPYESTTVTNNYYNDTPDYNVSADAPVDDGSWGDDSALS
ncbi:DUF2076 family protein [Rugamonas sp.]|uniref:DUF2076 domain-containing protein n=1 Tax=Rugamonas sp. TaxID=1926287 RepID=UPI0025EFFD7E|nr:DUF2076 family protein [Rugamonas sp.]